MNILKRHVLLILAILLLPAVARAVSLSDFPLFLTAPVAPNVVMTLDNSGSMAWGAVPDNTAIYETGTRRYASSDYNKLYYDPLVTYKIPVRNDGSGVTYNTSFTNAYYNGFDTSRGSRNLNNSYRISTTYYNDLTGDTANDDTCRNVGGTRAACYFRYAAPQTGCTTAAQQVPTNDACYVYVKVGSAADVAGSNVAGGWSQAQKEQNFANWYSFYRTRALSVISSSMTAVGQIGDNEVRLAWQSISDTPYTRCASFSSATYCRGYTSTTYDNRIRSLTPAHRQDFNSWISRLSSDNATPLRSAMIRVGQYYQTNTGLNNPYAEDPQVKLGTELECRKNFHIMLTDGMWNGDSDTYVHNQLGSTADQDRTAKTLPDGMAYTPQAPYQGRVGDNATLSDIAFYYWSTDLRTDLADAVPPYNPVTTGTTTQQYWNARNDPATWQHMVNFMVGVGLGGYLTGHPSWGGSTFAPEFPSIENGTYQWPLTDATNVTAGNVWDLWHAAVNSRGQFFSVDNPSSMVTAFNSILNSINATVAAAAGLSSNSTSVQTNSLLFQGRFNPKEWSGQLLAYAVQSDGSLATNPSWDAAQKISSSRNLNKIFTWKPSTGSGVIFNWSNLDSAQQTALNTDMYGNVNTTQGTLRLDWLKGDQTKEQQNGGSFRNRPTTVLGDIVDADLVFTSNEDYGYGLSSFGGTNTEKSTYSTFLTFKANRLPMVYAGANDGMLHGFEADASTSGGNEILAYVPNAIYGKLSALTDPGYAHQYLVDSPPGVGDAYINGGWKTALVSGLGKGGQAVFALDVTDPANFGASNVLWEKSSSDTGFADLGYVYGKPKIAKLNSGQWVAIFSNGYNSTSGAASLFIVDLATGAKVAEIVADDGSMGPNGLSDVSLVDTNGDRLVDYAYAGDLKGNMWKFDLTNMTVSYKLFQATSSGGIPQPITTAPTWGASSSGSGLMLYFGTGQYLGSPDTATTDTETFYGLWDSGSPISGRANLQQQSILSEGTNSGQTLRETTNNPVSYPSQLGWYLDLGYQEPGERVTKKAVLALGWVFFTTVVPTNSPCAAGGDSWLFVLDPATGGRPGLLAIDVDGDKAFTAPQDTMPDGVTPPSAIKSTIGILTSPVVLGLPSGGGGSGSGGSVGSYDAFADSLGGSGSPSGASTGAGYSSGSKGPINQGTFQGNGGGGGGGGGAPTVNRAYWMQIQ